MKRKLFVAAILLIGFAFALPLSKAHETSVKTNETTIHSKPSKPSGTVVFKGENDYWDAEFSITKDSVNRLNLKHKHAASKLPQQLTFTLTTDYNKDEKQTQLGSLTLSFDTFPNDISLTFKENKVLKPIGKNLVLKITGEGHYQFFNLYVLD
jgi:hypothetical protein